MSRLAAEPATRLAVLLVFVIFCLRLPLLLVPLFSSPLYPLFSSQSPLTLLCCSPVYVRHIKLSIYCCKIVARCFLLLALPLAFLQTTPSHTHIHPYTHTCTQAAKCISVHCALSFRGFCYYCWQQFRRHADETTGVSACDLALALALPLPKGDGWLQGMARGSGTEPQGWVKKVFSLELCYNIFSTYFCGELSFTEDLLALRIRHIVRALSLSLLLTLSVFVCGQK